MWWPSCMPIIHCWPQIHCSSICHAGWCTAAEWNEPCGPEVIWLSSGSKLTGVGTRNTLLLLWGLADEWQLCLLMAAALSRTLSEIKYWRSRARVILGLLLWSSFCKVTFSTVYLPSNETKLSLWLSESWIVRISRFITWNSVQQLLKYIGCQGCHHSVVIWNTYISNTLKYTDKGTISCTQNVPHLSLNRLFI